LTYTPNIVTPDDIPRTLQDELDKIRYEFEDQRIDFIQPDTLTVNNGTPTGSVTDIQNLHDGNTLLIAEVAGTPGFDIDMDFSNVKKVKGIVFRADYSGSATHRVNMSIYDYVGAAYLPLVFMRHNLTDFNYETVLLDEDRRFISNNFISNISINHASAGSPSHTLEVDYVALLGTRNTTY